MKKDIDSIANGIVFGFVLFGLLLTFPFSIIFIYIFYKIGFILQKDEQMATNIIKCSCESDFQDKVYGKNMRVMNLLPAGKNTTKSTFRCTVCGSTKETAKES